MKFIYLLVLSSMLFLFTGCPFPLDDDDDDYIGGGSSFECFTRDRDFQGFWEAKYDTSGITPPLAIGEDFCLYPFGDYLKSYDWWTNDSIFKLDSYQDIYSEIRFYYDWDSDLQGFSLTRFGEEFHYKAADTLFTISDSLDLTINLPDCLCDVLIIEPNDLVSIIAEGVESDSYRVQWVPGRYYNDGLYAIDVHQFNQGLLEKIKRYHFYVERNQEEK